MPAPYTHTETFISFLETLRILQPAAVVLQGQGVARWTAPVFRSVERLGELVDRVAYDGGTAMRWSLSHPAAGGDQRWGDRLDAPYVSALSEAVAEHGAHASAFPLQAHRQEQRPRTLTSDGQVRPQRLARLFPESHLALLLTLAVQYPHPSTFPVDVVELHGHALRSPHFGV